MPDIQDYIREVRDHEVDKSISNIIEELRGEGFFVEFGKIGLRTTYSMIYDENHNTEIVGYTFVKDMKYYKENVGKLKALQQALARKNVDLNK